MAKKKKKAANKRDVKKTAKNGTMKNTKQAKATSRGKTAKKPVARKNVAKKAVASEALAVKKHGIDDSFDIKAFAQSVVMRTFPFPIVTDSSEKPPFIVSLDEMLARMASSRQLLLPDLQTHTSSVLVFSDYGGESAESRYATYSFLFTSYDAHEPVLARLRELREMFGLNEPFKEVCFKDSGYGPIHRCLEKWLQTADFAVGLLFTLIVDGDVASLFGANVRNSQRELAKLIEDLGLGSWKAAVAEKLVRVIHVVSYWIAVLTNGEQNICWMTDNDGIVANPQFVTNMQTILSGVMNSYLTRNGKVATALPFQKTKEQYGFSDFLSIPDLVAGGVESLFTRTDKMEQPTIRTQANDIVLWLCRQGVGLKKLTMMVKPSQDGTIRTSIIRFRRKDGIEEDECIVIDL